ncbi:hypothetical protein LTR36_007717 [Oleoguttula mirabilis]|uniref:CUE domain-containing protein n=1 Tax=Oleoguttula mirabilis TaxID=1507867 RepID=A0AAV9JU92_9PEZI|nr:hypothetical protein LTR36_007717 [Oleoguttula mirabilis]
MAASIPPLAPIPPASIRLSLAPEEWEACLDAWLTLADLQLRMPPKQYSSAASSGGPLSTFLAGFYRETANAEAGDDTLTNEKALRLRRVCFMLLSRIVNELDSLPASLDLGLLSDFCHVHIRSTALARLMSSVWKQRSNVLETMLQKRKDALTKMLEASNPAPSVTELALLAPIMRASADAGSFFVTGSDFLDALATSYGKLIDAEKRKPIVSTAYIGLSSTVKTETPNVSLLSDGLYSLKAQADKQSGLPSLLSDLVTNTPLLTRLRRTVGGKGAERLAKLLDILETYRMPSIARPKKVVRRKVNKGKGRASQGDGELHMHRMSLVTQIQDLFPDLGSGFILRLLDEYDDNVEQATAHLLDDSLPPHLRSLDRSEHAPVYESSAQEQVDHLAPRSTPPPLEPFIPDRRNAFDDDDLLAADASRLHLGKRTDRTESGQPNKAAILSALAAFDADDDERDDTYDVEDVGGTIDTAHPDGEPGPSAKVTQEENDMALFKAYRSSPELFGRTFNVRRGQPRSALKAETGMTDEAIEGWAIMLQREPRRLKNLESRAGAFDGRQTEIASTAYRDSAPGTETEDSDVPGAQQATRGGGFGGRGGRGRGGRGRGRGGSVAGPADDASTANAQKRKEASKGSRANHNRRDQRAKKMARGGFPG